MEVELSPRELEVLRRLSEGQTREQIAEEMYLSSRTVDHMLSNDSNDEYRSIYLKIGAKNQKDAVTWYMTQRVNKRDEAHLETLYRVHIEGDPWLAIQRIDLLISDIREEVGTSNRPRGRLDLLARVLDVKGWFVSAISEPKEFYAARKTSNEALTFAEEMSVIGKQLDKPEYLGKADQFRGDAYHVAEQHFPCIEYMLRALPNVKIPYNQVHIHRVLACTYSALPEREKYWTEFNREVEEVAKLNDSGSIPDEWGIVADEGVARAFARFGKYDQAFEWIQKGYGRLDRMAAMQQQSVLRILNMGRAELFAKKESKTGHPDDWKETAQKLIKLDPDQQYPRLAADLRKYLQS